MFTVQQVRPAGRTKKKASRRSDWLAELRSAYRFEDYLMVMLFVTLVTPSMVDAI
jgi:hypothetical protein